MTTSEITQNAPPTKGGRRSSSRKHATAGATPQEKTSSRRRKPSSKTQTLPVQALKGSKTAKILGLLRRETGTSIPEMMKVSNWQAHSIRGFLSTAPKKYQVKIESTTNGVGKRVYRISK